MRCKLSHIKHLIKEASDSSVKVHNGQPLVRLADHKDKQNVGQKAYYFPSEIATQVIKTTGDKYQKQYEKSGEDFWKTMANRLYGSLRYIGQILEITKVQHMSSHSLVNGIFPDNFDICTTSHDLWIPIDPREGDLDYRPDETLPEDYYAL